MGSRVRGSFALAILPGRRVVRKGNLSAGLISKTSACGGVLPEVDNGCWFWQTIGASIRKGGSNRLQVPCSGSINGVGLSRASMKFVSLLISVVAGSKFEKIVTFGDGYSDTGLALQLTDGAYPGKAYYEGRLSNGPVWTEHLAKKFNATLINYAVAMATSDNATFRGTL